jgi:hypothetical protein
MPMRPLASSTSATSVKVPPISTPTRHRIDRHPCPVPGDLTGARLERANQA